MFEEEQVKLKWHYRNKEEYINKGYAFTKFNDEFECSVYDLGSTNVKVKLICDTCGNKVSLPFSKYLNLKNNKLNRLGDYQCLACLPRTSPRPHEEFLKDLIEIHGTRFTPKEEYIGKDKKISFHCSQCNNILKIRPSTLLKGQACIICAGLRKKTNEEFLEEVHSLVGDEYEFIDEYVNSSTKLLVVHKNCGTQYSVKPNNFLVQGARCATCSKKKKLTTEEFKKEIFDAVGNEYILLSEYRGTQKRVEILHTKCGNVNKTSRASFIINGSRCLHCSGKLKKTTDTFKTEVENLVGNEYIVIGEYVSSSKKITFRHSACDKNFNMTPSSFLRGSRCSHCYGTPKKTTEEFASEVENLSGGEYRLVSEYQRNRIKVELYHKECGNTYKTTPTAFLSGNRCPYCIEPKGEKSIREFLHDKVIYKAQFIDEKCIYKSPLRFDFAIFDSSGSNNINEPSLLIEYDGEQHFHPIKHWGGEKALKEAQKRDAIKNEYCKKNNIPLLRIPYWEYSNIEKILTDKLLELGLIKEDYKNKQKVS